MSAIPHFSRRRYGVTLIELMVVISLASVALGTIGMMLSGMLRVQRAMAAFQTNSNSVVRFAEQFRNDVHAAVNESADGALLRLELPDERRIDYRFAKPAIERAVFRAESVVQRESYELPSATSVVWSVAPLQSGRLASAVLKYAAIAPGASKFPDRELKIEAAASMSQVEQRLAVENPQ